MEGSKLVPCPTSKGEKKFETETNFFSLFDDSIKRRHRRLAFYASFGSIKMAGIGIMGMLTLSLSLSVCLSLSLLQSCSSSLSHSLNLDLYLSHILSFSLTLVFHITLSIFIFALSVCL